MANIAKEAGTIKNPVVAGDLDAVTMTAGTISTGDLLDVTGGNCIVIFHNTSADTEYDVTINGEPGSEGRDVSIVVPLAAGDIKVFGPVIPKGWATAAGKLSVVVENAAIEIGVLDLHR